MFFNISLIWGWFIHSSKVEHLPLTITLKKGLLFCTEARCVCMSVFPRRTTFKSVIFAFTLKTGIYKCEYNLLYHKSKFLCWKWTISNEKTTIIQGGAKGGLPLWVLETEFVLLLLFINECIIFHMSNCKPTFAPCCIIAFFHNISAFSLCTMGSFFVTFHTSVS